MIKFHEPTWSTGGFSINKRAEMNPQYTISPELMRKALGASMRNPELQRIFKEAPQAAKPVLKLKFAVLVFPDQISDEAFGVNLEALAKSLGADDLRYLIDTETDAGMKAYFESLLQGSVFGKNSTRAKSVVCPYCHAEFGNVETDYGRFVKCEGCGGEFIVGQTQRTGLHGDRNFVRMRSFALRCFQAHLPRVKQISELGVALLRQRPYIALSSFVGFIICVVHLCCVSATDKMTLEFPTIPDEIPSWQRNGLNLYNTIVTNTLVRLNDEEILEGLLGANSKTGVRLSNNLLYRSYVVVEQKIQCSESAFMKYYDDDVLKLNEFMKGKGFQIKIKEGGNIEIEIAKLEGKESGVIKESMKEGFIYPKGVSEILARFVWTQCSWLSNIKRYFLHSDLCLSNGEAKRRFRETMDYAEEKFPLLKLDVDSCLCLPQKYIKVQKTRVCGKWNEIKQDLEDENWLAVINKMKMGNGTWKISRPRRSDVVTAYAKILNADWTVELTYRDLSEQNERFKVYDWDQQLGFMPREKDLTVVKGASENHLTVTFSLRHSPSVILPAGDFRLKSRMDSICFDYMLEYDKTKVSLALGLVNEDEAMQKLVVAKKKSIDALDSLIGCGNGKLTQGFPKLSHVTEHLKWEKDEERTTKFSWRKESSSSFEFPWNATTISVAKQSLAEATAKIPEYEECDFPEFENGWKNGMCTLSYNDGSGPEWTSIKVARNENAKLDIEVRRAERRIARQLTAELAKTILQNRIAIDEYEKKQPLMGREDSIHVGDQSGMVCRLGNAKMFWMKNGDYHYFVMKKSLLNQEFDGEWDVAFKAMFSKGEVDVCDADESLRGVVNQDSLVFRKWPYQWHYEYINRKFEAMSLCAVFVKDED